MLKLWRWYPNPRTCSISARTGSLLGGDEDGAQRKRRQRRRIPLGKGNRDAVASPGPLALRNLRPLLYGGIAELSSIFMEKFLAKTGKKMVQFVTSQIGICFCNHAHRTSFLPEESIDKEKVKDSLAELTNRRLTFCVEGNTSLTEESIDKEKVKDSLAEPTNRRLTFCVEGNISVGKSTYLQRITNDPLLHGLVDVVPEPISKWRDIGAGHDNILDAFYTDPPKYAYLFQSYTLLTRAMQERESASGLKPLRLMERSVFSDRMVFVPTVHEAKWMNAMEMRIYISWFDHLVSCFPGLVPDGFIYLRATPTTCYQRMLLRHRSEEGHVTLDYLRRLHEKLERWLFPLWQNGTPSALSNRRLHPPKDNFMHPDIIDRVFYLEGRHLHSSAEKVPILVVDYEANINFNKDTKATERYARQIVEFFKFVKKQKRTLSS